MAHIAWQATDFVIPPSLLGFISNGQPMTNSAFDFTYDAFIPYSHHDDEGVHDRLLPRLEAAGTTFLYPANVAIVLSDARSLQ